MNLLRTIQKEDTIFIIIDPQIDFCSIDGIFGRIGKFNDIENTIDNIIRVKRNLESAFIKTIFFKQIYDPETANPLKLDLLKKKGSISCDIRTNGHNFYRIMPNNNLIFTKNSFYNCFLVREFNEFLADNQIRSIIVSGFDTHICVESTIRAGYDLGYQMILLLDCIGVINRKEASK